MRHVILGGGIAGTTAAEELRKLDAEAEITLVGEEEHPLYSRVLLPHYVKGKVPRERVFLKHESWYEERGIEWLRGISATRIDPGSAFVVLSDGRELPYDDLLIASGGEVRLAPEDLRGVSYFRTLGDADHLLRLLEETPAHSPAAVYGGGFIACEYINIFAQFGRPTTVFLRGDRFWSRILDEETGRLLTGHLEERGVEVVRGNEGISLEGESSLSGMNGRPCTIAGIGIGIEPYLGWIRDAGIATRFGVRTDASLRTNVPGIFAAGDIAEYHDAVTGGEFLVGTWMNAQMQGRHVAKVMAGDVQEFRLVSSYATNALGLEIIFVGDTRRELADEIQVTGSAEQGGVTQVFVRGGKTVGATVVGRNRDRQPLTDAIRESAPPPALG